MDECHKESLFINLMGTYRETSLKYYTHPLMGCALRHQTRPLEEDVSFKYKTHPLKQVVSIKKQHIFLKKKNLNFHLPI